MRGRYRRVTRLKAANLILRTPLLESLALNNMTGARVLVKAENLQVAGSFKIRGALNALLCLAADQVLPPTPPPTPGGGWVP